MKNELHFEATDVRDVKIYLDRSIIIDYEDAENSIAYVPVSFSLMSNDELVECASQVLVFGTGAVFGSGELTTENNEFFKVDEYSSYSISEAVQSQYAMELSDLASNVCMEWFADNKPIENIKVHTGTLTASSDKDYPYSVMIEFKYNHNHGCIGRFKINPRNEVCDLNVLELYQDGEPYGYIENDSSHEYWYILQTICDDAKVKETISNLFK